MARESKTRAVLFADISESGVLYRKLGDTAARGIVTACFKAMTAVLERHGGEIIKTLGDAILCVFPDADSAVLAAGEMQSVVTSTRPGDYPVAIHIGIHYGPVLWEDGDVFGDTVNVAAYLTAVAMREQVLATEATENALSPALKTGVRSIFNTVLKGTGRESAVYEVLWNTDRADMTQVNVESKRVIPGDAGSLLVVLGANRVRIDQWKPSIEIGRGEECDLVVKDRYASRQHVTVRAMRTRFYLVDHSINGTYVRPREGGEEIHVMRGELLLEHAGEIRLGRPASHEAREVITFEHDRRSMYRI
jgi:adenylate cyclase